MKHAFDLKHLEVARFCREAGELHGKAPIADLPRVKVECVFDGADKSSDISYSYTGSRKDDAAGTDENWLHLRVRAKLLLTCQRCLDPVNVSLDVERNFRFVATEALAEVEDEESDEDVLVLSHDFDALELLEDELIMAMPAAPMHEQCPKPIRQKKSTQKLEETQDRPNPFLVLQGLKKGGSEGSDDGKSN